MNRIVETKDRAEWLKLRDGGIGSSEVPTLLGLNPFETPYALWRRKRGLDGPQEESEAMLMGHLLEDAVAKRWERETGFKVIPGTEADFLFIDPERPFMRVSPDRLYKEGEAMRILECKTTGRAVEPDDIPLHWFVQVQYQMGVAGIEKASIAWLVNGRKFGSLDMDLVPDYFATLSQTVARFWEENVVGGKEPEPMDVQDVQAKFAQSCKDKIVEATPDILEAYTRLKDINGKIAGLEAEAKAESDKLKMFMLDAEIIEYEGQKLCTWKSAKDTASFDAKRFCKEHPDMAKEYMVAKAGTRRFLLK